MLVSFIIVQSVSISMLFLPSDITVIPQYYTDVQLYYHNSLIMVRSFYHNNLVLPNNLSFITSVQLDAYASSQNVYFLSL